MQYRRISTLTRPRQLLLMTWLLFVSTQALSASARSITYSFELEQSSAPKVCNRMGRVFNEKFRNLWDPANDATDEDLAATGSVAFRKLAGVSHDPVFTLQMIGAKLPASEEFEAIDWREGRVTTGAPPGTVVPESDTSLPALVAYTDIDNDGKLDTLLRYGFNEGYRAMRMARIEAEYLRVWRSRRVEIPINASLWQLANDSPASLLLVGSYLRPFILNGSTYFAKYSMELGELDTRDQGPFPVISETMEILQLKYSAETRVQGIATAWSDKVICRFKMQQR